MNIIAKLKKSNFFNHSKNYLIAEFFNKGIVFLTLPMFTYLLTPDEFGIISIFLTIVSIFIVLFGFNSHTSIVRKYHESSNDFKKYLGTNLIFILFFNIFILLIIYQYRIELSNLFMIDSNLLFIASLISSLSVFMQLEFSYLQTSQNSQKYTKILVIRNIFITFGALIWMYLLSEDKYLGKIYSDLLVMVLVFIFVMYNLYKLSEFKFDVSHIKYSLSYGVPLIPHSIAGLILLQSDRLMINKYIGEYETGLYSFGFSIGMIMMLVVTSFNNAWIPIFYSKLKDKMYTSIQEDLDKYVKIIFVITLILILFSNEIVIIMADSKYYDALEIVPIIILSFAIVYLYTIFANYAFYKKNTLLISVFTSIAGIFNIVLNYYLLPKYGYTMAAYTTLLSYLLLLILHYINVKFIVNEKIIVVNKISINFMILLLFVIIYYNISFEEYIYQFFVKIGLIVILIVMYFGINKLNLNKGKTNVQK